MSMASENPLIRPDLTGVMIEPTNPGEARIMFYFGNEQVQEVLMSRTALEKLHRDIESVLKEKPR
jgi:hypothetical protein